MYTLDEITKGIINYIKMELMPVLPGTTKVLAGAVLIQNIGRASDMVRQFAAGDLAKTLGIIADDGRIDADKWILSLKSSMNTYGDGKLSIKLPLMQEMTFRENDLDTLKRYIKGDLQ